MATTKPIRVAWLGDPLGIPENKASPRRRRREIHGPGRRYMSMVRETAIVLVAALVISFAMKTYLVQAFFIPSGSMENTMIEGDRVVVNKLAPGPFDINRGDVVVFEDREDWLADPVEQEMNAVAGALKKAMVFIGMLPPDDGDHLIKRVIGTGGDTVQCCDAQERLLVNGVAIDEPYLFPGDNPSLDTFSVVVPKGKLWVMGDHRSNSEDSRAHMYSEGEGFISEEAVVGVAFSILWPLGRTTILTNPSEVFATVPDPKVKNDP